MRDGVQLLAQELMDAEVTDLVGAELHQRTAGRTTYRNGYGIIRQGIAVRHEDEP